MLNWLRQLFARTVTPVFSPESFLVWEPCTYSHAEVVPGYVGYLLDLGFKVEVFITPERYEEGLFCRLTHPRLTLQRLSQRAIRRLFRRNGMGQARGIIITTARKISGKDNYLAEQRLFAGRRHDQTLLLVEHDIKAVTDNGALTSDIITLRQANYHQAVTTVINPHWFGQVRHTPKNQDHTQFIMIGALRSKRRNTRLIVDAVQALDSQGIHNFQITVIGRGDLRGIPKHLQRYFNLQGRVDFTTLYAQLEQADFFLTLLDPESPAHDRYITTGTSGSFQLIYGFAKPALIAEKFAPLNGFNSANSLVYPDNAALTATMHAAISMSQNDYAQLQQQLQHDAAALYRHSLANLRQLISAPPCAR